VDETVWTCEVGVDSSAFLLPRLREGLTLSTHRLLTVFHHAIVKELTPGVLEKSFVDSRDIDDVIGGLGRWSGWNNSRRGKREDSKRMV
jgi:hypothetical protein